MTKINSMDFPEGAHLVVNRNGYVTVAPVEVSLAPMIAAGTYCISEISQSIFRASEIRPHIKNELTVEQKEQWDKLVEAFGDQARYIEVPSAREAAQAGVNSLIKEAEKLMQNPNVKKAFDNFMTICKLTKEQNDANR